MPIEVEASSISYVGNGAQVDFPTTFSFGEASDLTVEVDDVVKTLNVDYTVSGAGAAEPGGTVTFLVAPANAAVVYIERNTPITQLTNFVTSGPFSAATITRALDKLTRICQSLKRRILALEALLGGVNVPELADAVAFGDEILTSDPVEDTFPIDMTCAGGDIATQVVWHVFAVDGDDNPFDEPPVVDWIRGPTDKITIRRISGLRPNEAYNVQGLAFF